MVWILSNLQNEEIKMTKKNQKPEMVVVEPMPKESSPQTQLLKEGAAIVRLENTTQMQVALQRPRDKDKILDSACKSLDKNPAFAEFVRYRKPVGKNERGEMNYAEGLNIKAAEALKIFWGNCASAGEIISETDDDVVIACAFVDYETNIRTAMTRRVAKYYTTKDRKVVRYTPDRFDQTVAAKMSILMRETILRSLPPDLKMAYEGKAVQVMRKRKAPDRLAKMLKAFESLGVKQEQLESLQGKPYKEFAQDDADALTGIYNAIVEKESTIQEIFGEQPKSETEPSKLKVKQAAKNGKKYKCQHKDCGKVWNENQLEMGDEGGVCPDCGYEVEEIIAE
jgi:DNA-directed RNA polymerase subunit RPC12/RpoP